ncbi:MAG TPA: nucleotidyltransferase family protein [Anaerolineales bacterium]|jgi:molybdenum cofactor cytidylyltransferase|nr:nucleotidyltransferase family protein [Anaerolineales bacterium]
MITAIILAAGESKRMGQPKMLLPWDKETVLGRIISVIQSAGMEDILVVTGGGREQVEEIAKTHKMPTVFNSDFATGEMLSSLQCGLKALKPTIGAALICLGDQPQVEERSVRLIVEEYERTGAALIVPSYQMRRGHPWLLGRKWWNEVLAMSAPESPRDFLNRHALDIHYLNINSPSVLADLDTLEDYLKAKP